MSKSLCRMLFMAEGVFVFANHMSLRPERFNSRFNLLGQSPFCPGQLDPQILFQRVYFGVLAQRILSMLYTFVFVRIGNRPTSDLHAFVLQNLLTPNNQRNLFEQSQLDPFLTFHPDQPPDLAFVRAFCRTL